ncbi:hypothetical protein ACHHYP_20555 [Achlya hypogyna]|uniref:DDE-1 domain-containing protein n=1 Tax=Achlya hypogyna TaxID=1202772 RepID=A0A1V9YJ45_ACHHY|nr:hypothetical protein ACHHYP_20555 [Achlya hypogyna]
MHDLRRENRLLTVAHMHTNTINATKFTAAFVNRYGFARRRATSNKLMVADMEVLGSEFARVFWLVYPSTPSNCVANVDETGICYDIRKDVSAANDRFKVSRNAWMNNHSEMAYLQRILRVVQY